MLRRLLFLFVGTLVLWYLGHFGLNALFLATGAELSAGWTRAIDLALVPLCLLVSWLVMRRLTPGPAGGTTGSGHGRP
ncbi:MAG TPA: hypothetical protein VKU40_14495 [Thermoanaerobaculia bacterium]|nr:hypothetical protein [Thermoanaerobaculia bacterium]